MEASDAKDLAGERIDRIRSFERQYEHHLRDVRKAMATEDFTAADNQVLHELAFAPGPVSGAWLAGRLDLDSGYLSRILKKLQAYGLVTGSAPATDGRVREWDLTASGRSFAQVIEAAYRERVRLALFDLSPMDQRRLVEAMAAIEGILRYLAIKRPTGERR